MSIETLKVVTQRLKPVERKIRQILRIGKVSDLNHSELNIQFSELEEVKKVPFLSINGLQISPKVGDFVLVYSPEGRFEYAVALAVVSMAQSQNEHEVTLSAKDKTLGNVLKDISDAIHQITSPGFFTVTGTVATSGPGTYPVTLGKASCQTITISTKGFK
jgi:hypothetical protein